jgi:DNA-directed RNA polymerase specialized sigma24 family protein
MTPKFVAASLPDRSAILPDITAALFRVRPGPPMIDPTAPQLALPDASDSVAAAYEQHYGLLESVAAQKYRIPRHDIGPLIHEVFIAYLRNDGRIRDERAWLVAAMCNWCRLYWRGRDRDGDPTLASSRSGNVRPPDLVGRIDLATLLRRIPCRCRDVLRLRFSEEYSSAELARHFATTVDYARKMVYRCLAHARSLLERTGEYHS